MDGLSGLRRHQQVKLVNGVFHKSKLAGPKNIGMRLTDTFQLLHATIVIGSPLGGKSLKSSVLQARFRTLGCFTCGSQSHRGLPFPQPATDAVLKVELTSTTVPHTRG